jgi:hypothetical protein
MHLIQGVIKGIKLPGDLPTNINYFYFLFANPSKNNNITRYTLVVTHNKLTGIA